MNSNRRDFDESIASDRGDRVQALGAFKTIHVYPYIIWVSRSHPRTTLVHHQSLSNEHVARTQEDDTPRDHLAETASLCQHLKFYHSLVIECRPAAEDSGHASYFSGNLILYTSPLNLSTCAGVCSRIQAHLLLCPLDWWRCC